MKEKSMEENKEKTEVKEAKKDGLLMKPFELGWTREVVKRSLMRVGTPDYDIYYYSPSGKKIRSLIELKHHLTDGLNSECFSFKRKPLGFSTEYETVRNARVRKKGSKQGRPLGRTRKTVKSNAEKENNVDAKEVKKEETQAENEQEENKESITLKEENKQPKEEKLNGDDETEAKEKNEKNNLRSKRVIKLKKFDESTGFSNRLKAKSKEETVRNKTRLRPQSVRRNRKEVLKTIMKAKQAKQTKVGAGSKRVKKIVRKKSSLQKAPKTKKETGLKGQKSKILLKSNKKLSRNAKSEGAKEGLRKTEPDDKASSSDLKSIVKKNIGKYREMREKEKLGKIFHEIKTVTENSRKTSSGPSSKNMTSFLKPLQNGWRRELVFRRCSKQQADVYYFHPNGKKLRSRREIAEHLTHGLSIECFTFKKEVLGYGAPAETVRSARPNKNISNEGKT